MCRNTTHSLLIRPIAATFLLLRQDIKGIKEKCNTDPRRFIRMGSENSCAIHGSACTVTLFNVIEGMGIESKVAYVQGKNACVLCGADDDGPQEAARMHCKTCYSKSCMARVFHSLYRLIRQDPIYPIPRVRRVFRVHVIRIPQEDFEGRSLVFTTSAHSPMKS